MRYLLAALVGLGLIILVLVLIFHGGGSKSPSITTPLPDYSNSTSGVRLTIDGPVSASQTHHDARITVTQTEATLDIIEGYENDVIDSKTYPMNPDSYAVFLRALDKAGYTKGDTSTALKDERGYCSTGRRYIFELKDGDKQIERFWGTSCGTGTFKGNSPLVRELFQAQVPAYSDMAGRVSL